MYFCRDLTPRHGYKFLFQWRIGDILMFNLELVGCLFVFV